MSVLRELLARAEKTIVFYRREDGHREYVELDGEPWALLLDMADALDLLEGAMRFEEDREMFEEECRPLLARLAVLEQKARP